MRNMKSRGSLLASLSVCFPLLLMGSGTMINEAEVVSTLEETQTFLTEGLAKLRDGGGEEDMLTERLEEFQRELDGLQTLQEQLKRQEKEIERLVALANAKQLEDLATRLATTLEKEMVLRSSSTVCDSTVVEEVDFVDRDDLRQQLGLMAVLNESESQLSEWMLKIARDELEQYKRTVLNSATEGTSYDGVDCPAITEVVKDVQVALTKFSQDGIGLVDHARGAEVVYSMTSPTYEPPLSENELLGSVWWRRYIPEDWEKLLPVGWEHWPVILPSYVYHSLNIMGAKAAPAESILEEKVVPGSCWPMDGSHGQVTIRLPYTIKVESFTLDHVSRRIIPDDMLETAPKKVKVIAYPPCSHPEECGGLGFDVSEPMEVAQFEYDIEGSISQTFNSVFVSALPPVTNEIDGDGSCSAEAAACTSPPHIDVAAITLKVTENYGSPDYTCIYRFRVHGSQVF